MKYSNGEEVNVGDMVDAFGSEGIVVYVIDTHQYSEAHPKGSWDYLGVGMMVETSEMGLVHCAEPDDRVTLLSRPNEHE